MDRSLTDMLNKFFVPIEMLLGLLKNDEISQTFKTVQVVINSVISLVATVDDYQGSEFCSGLFFGMHGSSMPPSECDLRARSIRLDDVGHSLETRVAYSIPQTSGGCMSSYPGPDRDRKSLGHGRLGFK